MFSETYLRKKMNNKENGKRRRRKIDHLKLFLDLPCKNNNGLDNITLIHQAIPELNFTEIDLSCYWLGKKLSAPLLINAITGGAAGTEKINASLARIAKKYKIAMAIGSQSAAFNDKTVRDTYQVARKINPEGLLLANVSALTPYKNVLRAIEMIDADGIQLHLNVLQELIMPEGDRNFRGILDNIHLILDCSPVPVIVKEVGFGLSREAAAKLIEIGVSYLDIGGYGGTNFAVIESHRNSPPRGQAFKSWGIPTALSLLEVTSLDKTIHLTASGGISSGLDICKALRLGADMVGIAGYFLRCLIEKGEEELSRLVGNLLSDLKTVFLLCGAKNLAEITKVPVIYSSEITNWLEQRNLEFI